MECDTIKERLSEYMDGLLDPEMEARIEAHVLGCETCKEELSSLEAVVSELRSLESVEAPSDFLEKLHARMESRFTFRKLAQFLFVPARTKIPLQAATAAAIVVIIFAGLYTSQPKKQVAMAPEPSPQIQVAQKTTVEMEESRLKEDAYRAEPALEMASAEKPGTKAEPIEWVLVLESDGRPRAQASQEARKAAPAARERVGVDEEEIGMAPAEGVASLRTPTDAAMDAGVTVSQVKEAVRRVGGSVVSVEYNEEAERPQTIIVEISPNEYTSFYEELGRLAPLRATPPTLSEKDTGFIQVRIRFISAE